LINWNIIRFVVAISGSYVGWLALFERWLDPFLRRRWGRMLRCSIVWMHAGGPFRIWGVGEGASDALNSAVGFLGSGTVLLSALVPAVLLLALAARVEVLDTTITATGYLALLPMVVFFSLRVLWRMTGTGAAEVRSRELTPNSRRSKRG
jgi:hypothetical protein